MGVLADEYVRVRADTSQMGRDLKREGGKAGKSFGSSFSATLKGVIGAAAVFKILSGAVGFLKEANAEARESQKVGAITTQIIKSTGGAAKISSKQVGALATAISNKTGVDDEAVQSGANLLLTFKNVRNETGKGAAIFDRATAAAVDLSAAGFGSVSSASKMLGKALNDPLKGITALSRAGVTFTDQQKKQIAAMVESGDVLGAQKLIMKEVESQVGDVAEASATAGEKMRVAWDNSKEAIGTALLPLVDKFATFMTTHVIPVISDFAEWLSKKIPGAITIVEKAIDGFQKVLDKIKLPKISFELGELKTANVEKLFESVKTAAADFLPPVKEEWTKIWQEAQKTATVIKTAIDTDMIPALARFLDATKGTGQGVSDSMKVIRVALAIIGFDAKRNFELMAFILDTVATPAMENLVTIYQFARSKIVEALNDIKANTGQRWNEISASTGNFVGRIAGWFSTMAPRVIGAVRQMWADVKAGFVGNQGVINTLTGGWVARIGTWFATMRTRIVAWVRTMWAEAKASFIANHAAIVAQVAGWWAKIKSLWTSATTAVKTTWSAFWTSIRTTASTAINAVLASVTTVLGRIRSAFSTTVGNIRTIWNGVKSAVSAPITWIKDNVYNKPLVPVWNRVAGLVNGPKLSAYARGGVEGVRPGYTPGRDTHLIGVGGGEAIMRPEWTRAVGEDWVNKANKAARTGKASLHDFLGESTPGFAGGGVVGWIKGLASSVSSKVGSMKDWALGGLRAAAAKILDPVKSLIGKAMPSSGVGSTVGGIGKKLIDLILDKIKTDDAAAMPALGGPAGSAIASGGWASIYRILRAAGARSFTTYAGHDQGASRSRDIWPPSQAVAEAARRLSSIWYVIYNRRIASVNYGRVWRAYNGSNPHTDHVHVTLRPGVAAALGGIVNAAGGIDGLMNGGLVKGGRGGVLAHIGEGRRDELVTPLPRNWQRGTGSPLDARLDRLIRVLEARGNEGLSLDLQVDVNTDEPRSIRLNKSLQKVGGGVGLVG